MSKLSDLFPSHGYSWTDQAFFNRKSFLSVRLVYILFFTAQYSYGHNLYFYCLCDFAKNRIYRFYHVFIFSHSRFTKTETTVLPFEGLKYINLEWCNECKWIMFERQYSFKTEKLNKILDLAELNAIITKKFQPTWSVASRPKSSGGLVMTYRLLEASNELDVSRNLKQLKSNIIAR